MLFRNMQRKYFDQAGQDGTEGGGAADAPTEPEKLFTQCHLGQLEKNTCVACF